MQKGARNETGESRFWILGISSVETYTVEDFLDTPTMPNITCSRAATKDFVQRRAALTFNSLS
jgi:hypothetical protein